VVVGSASATRRARSQLNCAAAVVAVGRPRSGAHVPAVGGVEIICGLQVLGDQGGILISRNRITAFDGGGQPPVQ